MILTVVLMIIVGTILCISSFFISEKLFNQNDSYTKLMTVDDDYEFSDRELRIIRRKIEDVIANHAKDILYETNESLANMANEKTMALGDYAVAVCEQIETNHKEVMFLYSMLDDKQKDIMKTVRIVNDANKEAKDTLDVARQMQYDQKMQLHTEKTSNPTALEQMTALFHQKNTEESKSLPENKEELESIDYVEKVNDTLEESEDIKSNPHTVEDVFTENEKFNDSFAEEEESLNDAFMDLEQDDLQFDTEFEKEFIENDNSNEIILQMHKNGDSIIQIAKQLGLGVGEVKLVIDLYQGDK